jgi:hypothetical protein
MRGRRRESELVETPAHRTEFWFSFGGCRPPPQAGRGKPLRDRQVGKTDAESADSRPIADRPRGDDSCSWNLGRTSGQPAATTNRTVAPVQTRIGTLALGWCSPRADPDRLRSRLVPTGRLENRHAPDNLATAPPRLRLDWRGFDLRALAYLVTYLLRSVPLGGTAHAFSLRHSVTSLSSANSLAALIGSAPARHANEPQHCAVVHT